MALVQYCCRKDNRSYTPHGHWRQLCKINWGKELLAVVFACEQFDQYVYCRQINVENDHKPLEMISKNPIADTPKRLQRMLLWLQRCDIKVVYKKGSEMALADTLSRAYMTNDLQEDADSV